MDSVMLECLLGSIFPLLFFERLFIFMGREKHPPARFLGNCPESVHEVKIRLKGRWKPGA